eukprot:gene20509-24618_t
MHNSYHRVGHGPHAVIVLHGWFGDAHAFAPMETALDGGAFSYVFMDNRGYGGMRGAQGDYSMEEVARDALALADALGFAAFSVVAHSMGGMALERLALLAPLRLRKLVAVAPVPSCGVALQGPARQLFLDASANIDARRAIIDRSTGGRFADRAAFAAYFLAWSDTDFSGEVRRAAPQLPLLALVGEHDPRFDADLMRRTAGQCGTLPDE